MEEMEETLVVLTAAMLIEVEWCCVGKVAPLLNGYGPLKYTFRFHLFPAMSRVSHDNRAVEARESTQ